MGIQNGYHNRPAFQPAAPRFAASNGGGEVKKTAQEASGASGTQPKKIGFFKAIKQTYNCLKDELSDAETRKVIKGFSLKHIPEMLMTALCAIPGVGWLANMVAIPLNMKLAKKGEETLVSSRDTLKKLSKDKSNPKRDTHKGLKHLIALDDAWNDPNPKRQYFGKLPEKTKLEEKKLNEHKLPYYLGKKYNKAIDGIFKKSQSLQNWLKINLPKEDGKPKGSMTYRGFRRWTEARQALRQSKIFGKVFNWMSGISHNAVSKAMPRFVRLFFLVPRVGLNGLYFMIGRKPKFKP